MPSWAAPRHRGAAPRTECKARPGGHTWEFEGEFSHPFPVRRHPRRAPHTNIGDDCTMIRVVMTRGTQTNAAILPTVGRPTEDIITLGGHPPPASSHPPRPSPPHGTAGSLKEVTGQIGEAHHVLHHLSNLLVPLVPWGTEVDVQIADEERNMPARAFVPGLLDRCQRAKVVRWDVAPHSKKSTAPRD